MSGPPSLKSLVCEEVFDERSQPSEEEVREYAVRIGINPDAESHLIPLAREGLLKPLPKNWKPVYDQESKRYYYFNFKTKQTSWEHPLDSRFRELVKKSRSESLSSAGEDDSKTSIKEELKSFEEAAGSFGLEQDTTTSSKDNAMDFSSQGVPALKSALSPLRTNRKEDQDSFSLRKNRSRPFSGKNDLKTTFTPKPLFSQNAKDPSKNSEPQNKIKADWDEFSSYLEDDSEEFNEIQGHRSGADAKYGSSLDYNLRTRDHKMETLNSSIIGRFTVDKVRKIDIDSQTKRLDSDGTSNIHRASDRFLKTGYGHPEFTLSGGGSVFLKSNKKSEVMKVEESSRTDSVHGNKSETLGEIDLPFKESSLGESSLRNIKSSIQSLASSPTTSASSTRSILRTPQAEKRLWDLDPQHMSVSEKALWKQQELEEEKKSVRFNLDKELNISFKLSDSSDSDSPSEGEHAEDEDIELNSNGSEDLAIESKLLHKDVSEAQQLPKKQKQLSPLEEWAKETWFSKKPTLVDKAEELKALAASLENDPLNFPTGRVSQLVKGSDNKEDETEEALHMSVASAINQNEYKNKESRNEVNTTFESAVADVQSQPKEMFSQSLLSKEDLKLSDIDDFLTSSTSKKFNSPSLQDPSSAEAHLVAALTKKLKGITSNAPEGLIAREARAREQAFRDWNVKQTDVEMYRPPLSRQQSQQQFQQVKQQIQEPAKSEDRDRALRAWNVTDANDSVTFLKSPPITTEMEFQGEGTNNTTTANNLLSGSSAIETKGNQLSESMARAEDKDRDRSTDSRDLQTIAVDFDRKLDTDIVSLKINYEMRVKQKELEYKKKFEDDKQEIVRAYQEQLEKLTADETKKSEQKCKEVVFQIERESDLRMKQLREQLEHKQSCAAQKILEQHQQALAAQEVENQAAMLRFREQHSAEIKTLREQFQREEEQIRREHQDRLVNLREDRDGKRSREITDHLRVIEKLRCEKRLVEDKYRILKEKYVKLKGELKATIEKKEQKLREAIQSDEKARENQATTVDPEASVSQVQQQSDKSSETESKPKTASAGSSATSNSLGFQQVPPQTQQQEQLNPVMDPPPPAPNSGPSGVPRNINNDSSGPNGSFLGMRFSNPPFQEKHCSSKRSGIIPPQSSWYNLAHLKTTERNGNIPTIGEESQWGPTDFQETVNELSPLEALRHQLQTLDELEEQFPVSSVTDAYLRYPFSDSGGKELESAELEFFRHRIHLERDMIRQAKSSLQAQQGEYRTRMHNFQQRQSSSKITLTSTTLYQMAKEEQELSDMEAKLRRTRTVLSEKMIHLRHLENSLNRLTAPTTKIEPHGKRVNIVPETKYAEKPRVKHCRRWDWRSGGLSMEDASDVSSDSGGSSGFSSTEYTSDGTLASLLSHTGSGYKYKRTPENTADINLSLHNLNAEISEIWNVLCKQRAAAGLGPPPLLNTQASTQLNSTTQQFPAPMASTCGGKQILTSTIPKVMPDKNSSLIERTNNLRQWLQKAKISATLPTGVPVKDKNEVMF